MRSERRIYSIFIILLGLFLINRCGSGLRRRIDYQPLRFTDQAIFWNQAPTMQWQLKTPAPVYTINPVNPKTALVTTYRGDLFLVDITRGKKIGRVWHPYKRPVNLLWHDQEENMIYISSHDEDKILGYDLKKAQVPITLKYEGISRPIVKDSQFGYMIQESDRVIKVDLTTGKLVKQRGFSNNISAGMYRFRDRLWLRTVDGYIHILDSDLNTVRKVALPGAPQAAPIHYDSSCIWYDSEGRLSIFDLTTCRHRSIYHFDSPIYAAPCISGDTIFVGLGNGKVVALAISDGNLLWERSFSGLINQPVVQNPYTILVLLSEGRIVALEPRTGEKKWQFVREDAIRSLTLTGQGLLIADHRKLYYYEVVP